MSIETEADWNGLRRVGALVRTTLDALERGARPGVTTAELDRIAERLFAAQGARSAPAAEYGFPKTVLLSVNDAVVHGIPGGRALQDGDVLKVDVTAELKGYVADAARTVLVGVPSETGRRLRDCVRAAFAKALPVARAGARVSEIGRAVEGEVLRRGFHVVPGLDGHGTGRAIHEPPSVPNRFDPRQRDVLAEGMVITIEPIVSAGRASPVEDADGWTIRTSDGSLAAHHEHTLVVTRGRPILLTAA